MAGGDTGRFYIFLTVFEFIRMIKPMSISSKPWYKCIKLSLVLSMAFSLSACVTHPQPPLIVNLVAINDFHGQLDTEKFSYAKAGEPTAPTVVGSGVEILAANLQAWRQEDKALLLIAHLVGEIHQPLHVGASFKKKKDTDE